MTRHVTQSCLYGSLFALTATLVVTSVALAHWSNGIADLLLAKADFDSSISTTRIIGGVDGATTDAYVAPAPLPVYRPANERLPSQMLQLASDSYVDVYGNAIAPVDAGVMDDGNDDVDIHAVATTFPAEDDLNRTIAEPDDTLAVQAAILDQMRHRASAPNDLQPDSRAPFSSAEMPVAGTSSIAPTGA